MPAVQRCGGCTEAGAFYRVQTKKIARRLWLESIITGKPMAELFREQLRDSAEDDGEEEVVE